MVIRFRAGDSGGCCDSCRSCRSGKRFLPGLGVPFL